MVDVITKITINAPLTKVWDYAANPDNAPEWYDNINSAEWKTPKPLMVDSQISFIAHFLGRKLVYTYEIKEFVPGQKLVMRTAEGPFPMETTYSWTEIDEHSTSMTLRNRGLPTGFFKLFSPFMAALIRKANKKDLLKLKKIMESY